MKKKNVIISFCMFLCVLVFMVVFLFFQNHLDEFQVASRISKVKTISLGDSDFHSMGWIRVQGTNIDYPVIRSDNYQSEFPVELESFAWSLNHDDGFHKHVFIMGHNIFNLSSTPKKQDSRFQRFEELMAFIYEDFASIYQLQRSYIYFLWYSFRYKAYYYTIIYIIWIFYV